MSFADASDYCQEAVKKLYKATVRPFLDYGDILYDVYLSSDAIEICQRKAALVCTGSFRFTSMTDS